MKLLLDTHAFLWAITGPGLSVAAQQAFFDTENSLYLSAASYWEICIKSGLGKLVLSADWRQKFDVEMTVNQIQWLPIEKEHCQRVTSLPFVHGDPFDRLLVAQALCENMTLVTADGNIKHYPVPILW